MTNRQVPTPKYPELIKKCREQLGETQTEFGKRFGVTKVAVSNWETGRDEPPSKVTWWLFHSGNRGKEVSS